MGADKIEIPSHHHHDETPLHLGLQLSQERIRPPVVREAIDDNNLPTKVSLSMSEGRDHKELSTVYVIYLKGVVLDT